MSATVEKSKYNVAVKQFKAFLVREELIKTHGNICKAAIGLGIHRNSINRMITEMNINVSEIKKPTVDK